MWGRSAAVAAAVAVLACAVAAPGRAAAAGVPAAGDAGATDSAVPVVASFIAEGRDLFPVVCVMFSWPGHPQDRVGCVGHPGYRAQVLRTGHVDVCTPNEPMCRVEFNERPTTARYGPGKVVDVGPYRCEVLNVAVRCLVRSTGSGFRINNHEAVRVAAGPPKSGATVTQLAGVSCTSATACVAVGYTARGVLGDTVGFVPLAEIWNGSKWRIASTPDPAHYTGSQLRGVSCTSATACVAVGFSVLGNERHSRRMTAFAERWNGVKWTLQPVAKVKNAIFTQLFGVSCTSPKACTAVGSYNADASLVERWNGSAWKVQPTPHPRTFIYNLTFLNGVSCSSSTACVAVGESETGRAFSHAYDTYRSLAERWNGRSWSIESTPRPQLANEAFLDGVSCVTTSACTAVGSDLLNPSGTDVGLLAESWSAMKWSIQTAPEPANPNSTLQFGAISCTSVAHCMAVGGGTPGGYTYPGGDSAGVVAEQESGAGWVMLSMPTPPGVHYNGLFGLGAADGLDAVSCTSPSSCVAVGEADISASSAKQLIERWNGVSWTIQATPTP
jgi:hypothetical protein